MPGRVNLWSYFRTISYEFEECIFLSPQGSDEVGQLFEKQNGDGAIVQGVTLKEDVIIMVNFNWILALHQTSEYNTPLM